MRLFLTLAQRLGLRTTRISASININHTTTATLSIGGHKDRTPFMITRLGV